MRSGFISGSRAAWYDRSSLQMFGYAGALFTPHALTERINYTVPAARALRISGIHLYTSRNTAPTVAGQTLFKVRIVQGGSLVWANNSLPMNIPAVGDAYQFTIPLDFVMQPTDQIIIYTQDASTGGNIYWSMLVGHTEYTA